MSGEGRKGRPEAVSAVLASLLEDLGLTRRAAERRPLAAWPAIVGDTIALHARPVDLADGVLTIEADHAAWRQELTLRMPQILRVYNETFGAGTVREIRWRRGRPSRRCDDA